MVKGRSANFTVMPIASSALDVLSRAFTVVNEITHTLRAMFMSRASILRPATILASIASMNFVEVPFTVRITCSFPHAISTLLMALIGMACSTYFASFSPNRAASFSSIHIFLSLP